jgi:hypothetical protein
MREHEKAARRPLLNPERRLRISVPYDHGVRRLAECPAGGKGSDAASQAIGVRQVPVIGLSNSVP